MKKFFLLLALVPMFAPKAVSFAAPVAKAWTTDAEPCWAAPGAGYDSHLVGRPWDTSGNHVNKLVATGSTGTSLTYLWTQLSGPSTVTFSPSATNASPIIGNVVPGYYVMHLKVTDNAAATSEVDLQVGAIGIDASGIVIPTDSKISALFGALIAFGYNPWCYADERDAAMAALQVTNNPFPANSAVWKTPGQGTIDYWFSGKGFTPGPLCTTLTSSMTNVSTTIAVADASCLNLSTFPTVVMVGTGAGNAQAESIRVISSSATSGAATLVIAHDGRGLVMSAPSNANSMVASAHSNGDAVGQYLINGTSTKFLTDPDRPFCPGGRGPMGTIFYNTGTAGKGSNSTTIAAGGMASWTGMAGKIIRLAYTYSGTPDVYYDYIATNADTTHITMTRPLPSDIDAGTGFTYQILSPLYISLEFKDSNDTHRIIQNGLGCESETMAFGMGARDIAAFNTTHQGVDSGTTGIKYSYKTNIGDLGDFGSNWYGTGLALRKFWIASGWQPAKTLADLIDDYWVQDPEVADGYSGGAPLRLGGGVNGAIIAKMLGSSVLSWYDVKQFGDGAIESYAIQNCNQSDVRDSSIPLGWTALLAYGDSARYSTWAAGLVTWATRENQCRRPASGVSGHDGYSGIDVNSWASSYNYNPAAVFPGTGSPALTLVNSSHAITPTVAGTLTSDMCQGVDDGTGTIIVVAGAGTALVASGSVTANKGRLWIDDTTTPYLGVEKYSGSGGVGSTITLGYLWPGASGTFHFMVQDTNATTNSFASIGNSQADTLANNMQLKQNWACHFTDSSHAELNRAWNGSSGSNWHIGYFNVGPGFNSQPFMVGIKAQSLYWGSLTNSDFTPLLGYASDWIITNTGGYAGPPYDLVSEACTPVGTPTPGTTFLTTHGELIGGDGDGYCGLSGLYYGASSYALDRIHAAEMGEAFLARYLADPSDANRAIGDGFYGRVFGKCDVTSGGGATFYCDANYVTTATVMGNSNIGSYKYPGFIFASIFTSEWPAIRQSQTVTGGPRHSATDRTSGASRQ